MAADIGRKSREIGLSPGPSFGWTGLDRDSRLNCVRHRLHFQGTRSSAFGAMFSIVAAREVDGTIVFYERASLWRQRPIGIRTKNGDPRRLRAGKTEILKIPLLE